MSPTTVFLTPRDHALLGLLEMTPATAVQLRKVSATFPGEPFRDERRVRERLQSLQQAGFIKSTMSAVPLVGFVERNRVGMGLSLVYRLTLEGYRAHHPDRDHSQAWFTGGEIAPSRLAHTMATAEVIVHTLVAAQAAQARLVQFHGDGRLVLSVGEYRQIPDCHFQFERAGKSFNLLFEIDNATEPLDSKREQSIRTKILGYERYQDWVLQNWNRHKQQGSQRPVFRVVFLTKGPERARHILWLAQELANNKDRRLCYASTQDEYLAEPRAMTVPLFNDHHGQWQSLLDANPTAAFQREPVRLKSFGPSHLFQSANQSLLSVANETAV